jgi:hypothetical protein
VHGDETAGFHASEGARTHFRLDDEQEHSRRRGWLLRWNGHSRLESWTRNARIAICERKQSPASAWLLRWTILDILGGRRVEMIAFPSQR